MKRLEYISAVIILIMVFGLGLSGCGSESGAVSCVEDTDGDGLTNCDETNLYGTNPSLADTDGDGFSDYQEIVDFSYDTSVNNYKFNPLIADTPKIGISITSNPDIDLNYSDSTGTQYTTGTSRDEIDTSTLIDSYNSTNGYKVEDTNTAGGTLGVDGKGQPSAALNYQYTNVTTREHSASWTQTQINEHQTVTTTAEQFSNSHLIATSSGSLSYTIKVKNEGNIAFTLNNLLLSAVAVDAQSDGRFEPVGNLQLQSSYSSYPTTTLGPGSSTADLLYSNDALDLNTTKRLLNNSEGLVTQVAAYELLDENGVSFTHNETAIFNRTAMVLIDYLPTGDVPQETYLVSTNAVPDRSGVSVADAMQNILKIPYTTGTGTLTGVRTTEGSATLNSSWLVVHVTDDGVTKTATTYDGVTAYDFEALTLHAGDVLHLVYLEDADGDGLGAREEVLYRTDPTLPDTDYDSLSDLTEVRGWQTTIDGVLMDVFSDPTRMDSDGDTLNDDVEKNSTNTDPRIKDSEGDGLNDNIDPYPLSPDRIDITGLTGTASKASTLKIDLTWSTPADANGIVVGVLFMAQNIPDPGPYDFPEPTALPVDGTIYPTRGVGIGGYSVVSYITGVPLPTRLSDEKYIADTGVFKYIAYSNVDLDGDGVGDIYIRSWASEEVAFSGSTDVVRVTLTGIYRDSCFDHGYNILSYPFWVPDKGCELYYFGYVNGVRRDQLTLLEHDASTFWLDPSKFIGGTQDIIVGHVDLTLPRVNGSCATFQINLYDSDDNNHNTTTGDQYSSAKRPHCYNNGAWSTGDHIFYKMALDQGGIRWASGSDTTYTVYYRVEVNP